MDENLGALNVKLSTADVTQIPAVLPLDVGAGARHVEPMVRLPRV